jgi:squalene-hopene/tetraprenyl-beta-curcumene cyclase
MEALCARGVDPQSSAIQRGVAYLLRTEEQDGSWCGRWGVNFIYGTFLAVRGLRAAGVDANDAAVLRAGEWLRSIQNADGGWGESCSSYDNHAFTPAPSTPSQTAWAILGLLASGDTRSRSVEDGIEFLVDTQTGDGTWTEELATGTGFPRVFYLRYHLYRHAFPLLAMSAYLKATDSFQGGKRK